MVVHSNVVKKTLEHQNRMAIAFTWGSTSLSYSFIMYVLICLSLGMYLVKFMYDQNKSVAAMILIILLIMVFIFFGKRWFQYGQLKGTSGWTQANSLAQSGSVASTAGQCGSPESNPAAPTGWPPVVNHCPDFMTLDGSKKCVDSSKLYGTGTASSRTNLGLTQIPSYTGSTNVCSSVTGPNSKYLRWEGVVQAEGVCNPGNIGRAPLN